MLALAVHSLFLKGSGEGMTFYLKPDFSKIDRSVIVGAMNQAFFTSVSYTHLVTCAIC